MANSPARRRKFSPSEQQLKYAKVYAENPAFSRRQAAEACGVTLDRATKWYDGPGFTTWLMGLTRDRIHEVVMSAAARRIAIDLQRDGKSGSDAALKIYLEGMKHQQALELEASKTGHNPMSLILQIGTDPGNGELHPAARIIEAQVADAKEAVEESQAEAPSPRQKKKRQRQSPKSKTE